MTVFWSAVSAFKISFALVPRLSSAVLNAVSAFLISVAVVVALGRFGVEDAFCSVGVDVVVLDAVGLDAVGLDAVGFRVGVGIGSAALMIPSRLRHNMTKINLLGFVTNIITPYFS